MMKIMKMKKQRSRRERERKKRRKGKRRRIRQRRRRRRRRRKEDEEKEKEKKKKKKKALITTDFSWLSFPRSRSPKHPRYGRFKPREFLKRNWSVPFASLLVATELHCHRGFRAAAPHIPGLQSSNLHYLTTEQKRYTASRD